MYTPVTPVLLHKRRVQGGPLPLFSVAFFQATNVQCFNYGGHKKIIF